MRAVRPAAEEHWKLIEKVYVEAFPANERKPMAMIRTYEEKGISDVFMLAEDAGYASEDEMTVDIGRTFHGIAIFVRNKDLVLLDYFAVSKEFRGQGYGSAALRLFQDYYRGWRFFLEIERVEELPEEREKRQKRKEFYIRNRMTEIPVYVEVYGVEMELLGYQMTMTYEEYWDFYIDSYGDRVRGHIHQISL